MTSAPHHRGRGGFTLIELSIVLVVIGLIVGGILVGTDMITAAKQRQQIAQIEQFDTAVNTFRSKYNGLPGDLANATQFGLGSVGGSANGNGDGSIDCLTSKGCDTYHGTNTYGESLNFWRHLGDAGLIPPMECPTDTNSPPCWRGRLEGLNPKPRLEYTGNAHGRTGIGLVATAPYNANSNAAETIPFPHVYYFGLCLCLEGGGPRSSDVYAIDLKIDDGLPFTGKVQSKSMSGFNGQGSDKWYVTNTGNSGVNTTPTPAVYTNNANSTVMEIRTGF